MGAIAKSTIDNTSQNPNTFEPRLNIVQNRSALVLRLGIAAESHGPTLAIVFEMTADGATARLRRKKLSLRWAAFKKARSPIEDRAKKARWWWRNRLSQMGIDPVMLDEKDPAWSLCWRRPRGWLVREIAAEMRAEHLDDPSFHLDASENLEELLRRVEVKTASLLANDADAARVLSARDDVKKPRVTSSKPRKSAPSE